MKVIIIANLVIALVTVSFSQNSFQKSLDIFLKTPQIRVSPDGQTFYVADAFAINGINRIHVYKLDEQGNILWHQEQISTDVNLQLQSIKTVENGVILLFSSIAAANESNGYLIKFDADGNALWNRRIGTKNFTQVYDVQPDDEQNLWLSGLHLPISSNDSAYYFLTKMNSVGTPIVSKQNRFRYFPHTGYEICKYTDLIWSNPNNMLFFVEDFIDSYAQSVVSIPNRGRHNLGFCDKDLKFDEKSTAFQMSKLESTDTSLFFSGWTMKGNFTKDKTVIGITEKTGKNGEVVKFTPTLFRPIHSRSGDIVFYVPDDKMLVKFDSRLEPVWAVKLDNCSQTNGFEADIAPNGAIYSVRNIDQKTTVAKVLPDGSLGSCISYPQVPPALVQHTVEDWLSYKPTGYPLVSVSDTLFPSNFYSLLSESKNFCVKMDASFEVPSTVCLGAEVVPTQSDTTEGILHTWDVLDFRSEDSIPEIPMPTLGLVKIFHTVENSICRDTASRYVQVVPHPVIPFQDTLVCGPAFLILDLSNDGVARYYLDSILTAPVINIAQSGKFTVRIENDACFTEKDVNIRIVEFSPPFISIDSAYCYNEPVKITLSDDFDNYTWDNKPIQDTLIVFDGVLHAYQARYKPDTACIVAGNLKVPRTNCNSTQDIIYAPNVFSPNAGAGNDVFQIFPTASAQVKTMKIFNRWGGLVYQSNGSTPAWDGTVNGQLAVPDVYTYWIEYEDLRDNTLQIKAGDVLLLR